ncbi:MAG: recombination-associated protein RdgC [Proteobacteria bacterium]|nr:recombination-associated protein RdgC [Pseudomonadota bacterium]MBU1708418.1 recombination-associated protein RdgC [Pseudomonadota bacterium]
MGMLSSSATFVRYSVEGDLPGNFWDFIAERIKEYSFRDIDDSYDEQSVGWVSVFNMFDNEFAYASYTAGDYVVLSLRIDERKVASQVLKKFCMKEEERIKKEKQIPKLSRAHRVEIKESIKIALTKKALPVPAVYDLSWNLSDNTLLFFSTSGKAQELLEGYFKDSFGLQLVQQIPYMVAGHMLTGEQLVWLDDITPDIFI